MDAVVLLRGVNVGGVRVPMGPLAAALRDAGFERVRTVLATGNVVLSADGDLEAIARRVTRGIEERFGHRVDAIAVTPDAVRSAVEGYPFQRAADRHAYVVFVSDQAVLEAAGGLAADLDPDVERIRIAGRVLYWDAPKGQTLTTAFGRRYGRWQAAGVATTRNLNTLEKILAVAG